MGDPRYSTALLDWLACAAGGREQPAARAARAYGDPVVLAGTSGHVLDFDDTYLPGVAHLSAPTAPAALVVAAELGLTVGEALAAFARGFEAMAAVARASHPGLYDNGWHPTAVCGGVGAAVAAATLLDAPWSDAVAIALLRASGTRAAFGSDGKSIQLGLAAASGVAAARLAKEGARVPLDKAAAGFAEATGGRHAEPGAGGEPEPGAGGEAQAGAGGEPQAGTLAVADNWIKAWPCCLQTHGAIEAADRLDGNAPDDLTVTVHPVSLQAAALGPEPADGLQAKFSIPYLTAYTLLNGPPVVESFERVDHAAVERAKSIEIRTDRSLLESEFVLSGSGGEELVRVKAALGSPQQPMDAAALRAKVERLAGAELAGALDDPLQPAAKLLSLAGIA
jgi:2-methylcitrate dehydratase PrpD